MKEGIMSPTKTETEETPMLKLNHYYGFSLGAKEKAQKKDKEREKNAAFNHFRSQDRREEDNGRIPVG